MVGTQWLAAVLAKQGVNKESICGSHRRDESDAMCVELWAINHVCMYFSIFL